jgi:hypothetical protein
MMFVLRAAFFLFLVILFLPADDSTGEAPRVGAMQALGAVGATAADLSNFCARNGDVCATAAAAAAIVAERVGNGVRVVQDFLDGRGETAAAGNALTGRDMATPWRAPAGEAPRRNG